MCGIAGIAHFHKKISPDEIQLVKEMSEALTHRGPDESGLYQDDQASLGHRRLKVIDLRGGQQPFTCTSDRYHLVFNGEIYNYRGIRQTLEKKGYHFKTQSDTEVLLASFEEYGEGCLQHLNGMFAFVIWDSVMKKMFLARDRMGQKPLFYSFHQGRLVFSSELKSLAKTLGLSSQPARDSVYYYFRYGYIPAPFTIFEQISKLEPGKFLTIDEHGLKKKSYWNIEKLAHNQHHHDFKQSLENIRLTLEDAVQLRMNSDVPLGAFLSGGVDSAIIALLMMKASGQQIHTFSIGFDQKEYSELDEAHETALHLLTKHNDQVISSNGIEVLDSLVGKFGEPFYDSSCIPTFFVSQFARKHVTVALSGDGADELFGGYERYLAFKMGKKLNFLGPAATFIAKNLASSRDQREMIAKVKRFLNSLKGNDAERYRYLVSMSDTNTLSGLFTRNYYYDIYKQNLADSLAHYFEDLKHFPSSDKPLLFDAKYYLPDDVLKKVDVASMANSLEVRSPFLDHRLIELVWSLPASWRLHLNKRKWLLEKSFEKQFPKGFFKRPKKGFGVPVKKWLEKDLKESVHDHLLNMQGVGKEIFQKHAIEKVLQDHYSEKANHEKIIWCLYMYERWERDFVA